MNDNEPIAVATEYAGSKENAKHTLRAMKENARQGFWNGSLSPIGYRIVEAPSSTDAAPRRPWIDHEGRPAGHMLFSNIPADKPLSTAAPSQYRHRVMTALVCANVCRHLNEWTSAGSLGGAAAVKSVADST